MTASRIALVSNLVFVGLLATLHVIKSDVDPSWHFISDYANGQRGWIMQVAFLCLAVSNLSTWMSVRDCLRSAVGKTGSVLFLVGTLGLVVAAIFVSDPVNTPVEAQTTSGKLHNVGGGLGILGFVGTLLLSFRLLRYEAWRPQRRAVWIATGILIAGFLFSFLTIAKLATEHKGVFSPDTPVGWPNRVGILCGCVWLAVISWKAQTLPKTQA